MLIKRGNCNRSGTVERSVIFNVAHSSAERTVVRNMTPRWSCSSSTKMKIRGPFTRGLYQTLLILAVALLFPIVYTLETDDQCNWNGSGLTVDANSHSVSQLHFYCVNGKVTWSFPRNGLHITFAWGHTKQDFRLCLNLKTSGNGANIYRNTPDKVVPLLLDDRPEFERNTLGTEVHVHEIAERLRYERTSPKEEHCFLSHDGKATIFVEAQFNPLSLMYVTSFDYRLEPLAEHRHPFHHVKKECRKCEGGEVLAAFCSADYAVKGRMLAVTEDERTHETYIDVAISHLYRQRDAIFFPGKHSRYYGLVTVPTRCKVQKLDGQYLMAGQINLGRAELGCMAHMAAVRRIAKEVSDAGISPCDLSSLLRHHRYIE
ncbi:meteorin-like protein [Diadema antillarum]|uniref:meteorin-like protein n=1 Tax=Diadema antillarum TaxID=105358 RepID=UPI003A86D380